MVQTTLAQQPTQFSNVQLEMLKLFAKNVPDADLLEIRRLIVRYMAEKASDWADKIWEEKNLDAQTILKSHKRTPYKQGS
jgi:DNA polymerase III delta subunit